jgi:hypothetical protein
MATQTTERSLDELAKGLATGTLSRGKAIRWMGGALLGAALASIPGVALADDDCRRLGRECRRDSQCCSKNCVRRRDDKVCACPEDKTRCGERCVNLDRNANHCGSCGNRCPDGQECVNGECPQEVPCPLEPTSCCQCTYENTTTGQFVSTCQAGVPDVETCAATCNAAAPPGSEVLGNFFAPAAPDVFARCVPAGGMVTGTECDTFGCTPPPA